MPEPLALAVRYRVSLGDYNRGDTAHSENKFCNSRLLPINVRRAANGRELKTSTSKRFRFYKRSIRYRSKAGTAIPKIGFTKSIRQVPT
jgi:hypothetical protein